MQVFMWRIKLIVGIARGCDFDNSNDTNNEKGTFTCIGLRGVHHLTLCQNHPITLFLSVMDGHVSMLGRFLTLAFDNDNNCGLDDAMLQVDIHVTMVTSALPNYFYARLFS